MIEQALYEHLTAQEALAPFLAVYAGKPAVFSQEAPADTDRGWETEIQYGRIVFTEDIQGDPERTMGGTLVVDIMCQEDEQYPEDIEPIVRQLIDGWFFSGNLFTVAAQFKNSSYFTQPKDHVTGCTVSFDLLAFPILTTSDLDTIARLNEWTGQIEHLHVLNYDALPATAWQPKGQETAVYWRLVTEQPANWIPDTFQTIWRTATIKGHIFSQDIATSSAVASTLITRLYTAKRLLKSGESPIMVNRKNTADIGADPLRTGQVTIEATYGVIVHQKTTEVINNIYHSEETKNG